MKMPPTNLLAVALLALSAFGCKKKAEEPDTQVPLPHIKAPAPAEAEGPSDVHVDERIARMCNMPTPNFEFDSAQIGPDAQAALDILAECFLTGAAKAEDLRLVGHADPRGDEEYNFALGQRRASGVAGYLEAKGLPSTRIETSSRGELDASGTDEPSWARDRRVDIVLAS